MQATFTSKQTHRRFKGILGEVRNVPSNSDVIRELVELSFALEDAPVRPDVIARLTLSYQDRTRMIIEIHSDARYASFYHIFRQQGNRRSTKSKVRTGGRHEAASLEGVAVNWKARERADNPITHIRINIYRRREYRRLVSARPDQLGLTKMSSLPIYSPVTGRHA